MAFILQPQRQPLLRRLLMWLLGTVLVILTAVSVSRVASLKQQLYDRAVARTEIELNNIVTAWETQLIAQIEVWLETANPEQTKSTALQSQLRRRRPWVDSLYLWVPPKTANTIPRQDVEPGRFRFPTGLSTKTVRRFSVAPASRSPERSP